MPLEPYPCDVCGDNDAIWMHLPKSNVATNLGLRLCGDCDTAFESDPESIRKKLLTVPPLRRRMYEVFKANRGIGKLPLANRSI